MSSGGESWALLWDVFGRPSVQQVPLALSRGNGGELFFVFWFEERSFCGLFWVNFWMGDGFTGTSGSISKVVVS